MGYYMRYFVDDSKAVALDDLQQGLREVEPSFRIEGDGDLYRGAELLAQLEVNRKGGELFDEELDEFLEMVADADVGNRTRVVERLRGAKLVVAAQVLWQGRTPDETLDLLSPLWEWLTENRTGLLQADGEGFYEGDELILELE